MSLSFWRNFTGRLKDGKDRFTIPIPKSAEDDVVWLERAGHIFLSGRKIHVRDLKEALDFGIGKVTALEQDEQTYDEVSGILSGRESGALFYGNSKHGGQAAGQDRFIWIRTLSVIHPLGIPGPARLFLSPEEPFNGRLLGHCLLVENFDTFDRFPLGEKEYGDITTVVYSAGKRVFGIAGTLVSSGVSGVSLFCDWDPEGLLMWAGVRKRIETLEFYSPVEITKEIFETCGEFSLTEKQVQALDILRRKDRQEILKEDKAAFAAYSLLESTGKSVEQEALSGLIVTAQAGELNVKWKQSGGQGETQNSADQ